MRSIKRPFHIRAVELRAADRSRRRRRPVDVLVVDCDANRSCAWGDEALVGAGAVDLGAADRERLRDALGPVDVVVVDGDVSDAVKPADEAVVHRRAVELGAADRRPAGSQPGVGES